MEATGAQQNLQQLKMDVQQKFNDLRAALHMREKLLLRQLDVITASIQQLSGRTDAEGAKGIVHFVTEQETELLAAIRTFGRFQLDNMNLALQDIYLRNEDYIEPADDHETMYKYLLQQQDTHAEQMLTYDLDTTQPKAIVVDFTHNKSLVEDNAKLMNKSIINITLQEAKDLIRKATIKREVYVPPLNLEELDDELESSIVDAMSSLGREASKSSDSHTCIKQNGSNNKPAKARKPRFKPKITINNCNGTINLRNIASLTINCANEDAVSAEIPIAKAQTADSSSTTEQSTPTTTASSSSYSSNASSRSQSKKQKLGTKIKNPITNISCNIKEQNKNVAATTATTTLIDDTESTEPTTNNLYRYADDEEIDNDSHVVTCDFYNRLLNEIKKSLKEKPTRYYDGIDVRSTMAPTGVAADSTCDANSNASSVCNSYTTANGIQPGKRLILKNFENLKIILEANNSGDEDGFHPVQIEQWLAEIISETDLEPVQNTEILEHSKIHSNVQNST